MNTQPSALLLDQLNCPQITNTISKGCHHSSKYWSYNPDSKDPGLTSIGLWSDTCRLDSCLIDIDQRAFAISGIFCVEPKNSLWHSDAICWQRSGSTLAEVMTSCLTAPSPHIKYVLWHSHENTGIILILGVGILPVPFKNAPPSKMRWDILL